MKVISNIDDFNASKVPDSEITAFARVLLDMVDEFMARRECRNALRNGKSRELHKTRPLTIKLMHREVSR